MAAAAPGPAIEIGIEAGPWGGEAGLRALAERAVAATLARTPAVAPGSELSLLFTDDAHIRALNAAWRGKDSPTNVLSFPGPPPRGGVYGPLLGDIVLAHETVAHEAGADRLTFADHLTHLIVHGLLHLLGHDHAEEGEAVLMEGLETAILGDLGIRDPYAEPPADGGGETG